MKWILRPEKISGLIFDMDNTLYANAEYTKHQEDVLVHRLAKERNESVKLTQEALTKVRHDFAKSNEGKKPSLGNAFLTLGIPMEVSIEWRKELIKPENYLQTDPELARCISKLSSRFKLLVITNNPVKIAEKTFEVLGLQGLFPQIIGLDTFGVSKPHPRAFQAAQEYLSLPPETLVSIGDRVEIDLEPALALGMGAVLIEHVREIHRLELEL